MSRGLHLYRGKHPFTRRFLFLLVLGIAAVLCQRQPLLADEQATTNLQHRALEPVVILGSQVANLGNLPIDEIFFYRFMNDRWQQIPGQIDEIDDDGVYQTREDGRLDSNDELVFMAKDSGVQAPPNRSIESDLPVGRGWYAVRIVDPLDDTREGWVYVVHSRQLTHTSVSYVRFDGGLHQIDAVSYSMRLGVTHSGIDYIAVGNNSVDLIDRTKVALGCGALTCPAADSISRPTPDNLVAAGPVRLLLRGGDVKAYGEMVDWSWPYTRAPRPVRFSFDFLPTIAGATLYNENMPQGVTVDGKPEEIPETPYSPWWQLSTGQSTLIHAVNLGGIDGTFKNYYRDDGAETAANISDSGDLFSYGDIGTIVESQRPFNYRYSLFAIPAARPNIGAAYAAFTANPLQVHSFFRGEVYEPIEQYLPKAFGLYGKVDDYSDFYVPPNLQTFDENRLGQLLRFEPLDSFSDAQVAQFAGLPSSAYGADAYRILYVSQAPAGVLRAVSGLLVVPNGVKPDGGFPIIAQGHFRFDQGDECAPSKTDVTLVGMMTWVAQGYMVVMTDYAGLGTPGPRPTLVGETEAWNLIDAARAAQRFRVNGAQPAGSQVLFMGLSAGAHGALFAHQTQPDYAPELDLVGTILFSPVTELKEALAAQLLPPPLIAPVVLSLHAYAQYYGAPAPESWLAAPYAADIAAEAESRCIVAFTRWVGLSAEEVFVPQWLTAARQGDWPKIEPWSTYLDANTPGAVTTTVPVLVITGDNDRLNPAGAVDQLVERLCSHNTPTEFELYPGADHFGIITVAGDRAIEWAGQRLQAMPITNTCIAE